MRADLRLPMLLGLLSLVVAGSAATYSVFVYESKTDPKHWLDVTPHEFRTEFDADEIQWLSPVSFRVGQREFRLLGLKMADDAEQGLIQWSELSLDEDRFYLVANHHQPIHDGKGIPLVWLRDPVSSVSINVNRARTPGVLLDLMEGENYSFEEDYKEGPKAFDWRRALMEQFLTSQN